MEQPLEMEGNKIDSLLTEMTDIVRKLKRHNADEPRADAAMLGGCSTAAVPHTEGARLAAE